MSSGIKCNDAVKHVYDQELKKESGDVKYMILKIANNEQGVEEVNIEEKGTEQDLRDLAASLNLNDEDENVNVHEAFKTKISEDNCAFVFYDFSYNNESGTHMNKILLITWCPDTLPSKAKMKYTTTEQAVKTKVEGYKCIQANDFDELSFQACLTAVHKK